MKKGRDQSRSPARRPSRRAGQFFRPGAVPADGASVVQRKCDGCEAGEKEEVRRQPMEEMEEESFERQATLQTKLTVGDAGDPLEAEADRVADDVMRSPSPEIQRQAADEITPLRRKSADGGGTPVSPSVEQGISSLRGGGRPLPRGPRAFMEGRFGADFGGVRVHDGAESARLSDSLSAEAFTVGSDVFFNRGRYDPESSAGRRLLAHELTHVVQQDGVIRRKIVLGTKDYNPKGDLGWIKKHYGSAGVEFLERMHNGGRTPEFKFDSFGDMHREVKLRTQAIRGMEEVHKGCCSYPSGGGTGQLDSTYWDKQGAYKFTMKSSLPSGKEPSDAIESIFKSGAGTELECNSTMVAIQYRAMLKTLGKTKFNAKFAGGAGIVISPHHRPPAGHSPHPIWSKKLYKRVTISGAADLLPGDWVYFKNVLDYSTKHPNGFWTGEHALYMGGGKFRGFGVQKLTETEINKELLKAYNDGLPAADQKTLADVPGLRDYARRPVIGEILKP